MLSRNSAQRVNNTSPHSFGESPNPSDNEAQILAKELSQFSKTLASNNIRETVSTFCENLRLSQLRLVCRIVFQCTSYKDRDQYLGLLFSGMITAKHNLTTFEKKWR